MERLLLKVTEAAELLGICRSQAYEMVARGELPSIRIGRSVRIPVGALRAWVTERTEAALRQDSQR